MKKIVLEFDDFSVSNNRLDLLLRLKESYPKLKVSMFTIPYDYVYENDISARLLRDKTLKEVKKHLSWIEIIPHGLTHMPNEFANADYKTTKMSLKAIDAVFKKDGIPYVKGFKAPYWLWNKEVIKALDDAKWWGAIDKYQKMDHPKRFYAYTHSIDERFDQSTLNVLKLHGHITSESQNGIEQCFTNLFHMPTDAEFVYASEMVEG